MLRMTILLLVCLVVHLPKSVAADEQLQLQLRSQTETAPGSGRFHRVTQPASWEPQRTAIIVCDIWDLHHCKNAVLREIEFAPRLNALLNAAREHGVTIIHAPSGCMAFYQDHPARRRAIDTPKASTFPADIGQWCKQIPSEERGAYPIDQSNGGEDDDPVEHAAWAKELADKGLDPKAPWTRQTNLIEIDGKRDYISDSGEEVWSILSDKGIDNVILSGVHTNMCVLGRPFGLRQMVQNGKQAALLRDMTDTMYDPHAKPYVSHFTGTDLIVAHIEKYVCPTITSDQFLGGKPFRFHDDTRPHVAIIMAEDEYHTEETLPKFALEQLGRDYRVSYVFGSETDHGDIPGLDVLDDADVLLVSARRRPIQPQQLAKIRKFVTDGKPMVGIRTASHAFCLRDKPAPEGLADWPEFDAQVWGGSYTNHHNNKLTSTVFAASTATDNSILQDVATPFPQGGSLYKTAPLHEGAAPLLEGKLNDEEASAEPVAWTFTRADGGSSFYTSLGHVDDFAGKSFPRLLKQAIDWLAAQRAASL
ncbi:MAG: isochorismatase family protein [Planctomycetaceae bacterium]